MRRIHLCRVSMFDNKEVRILCSNVHDDAKLDKGTAISTPEHVWDSPCLEEQWYCYLQI